jgi:hypothetical protein
MKKRRSPEENLKFSEWVCHHEYKEAANGIPMPDGTKEFLKEGAARSWMARIRNSYDDMRKQVNQYTTLMRLSPRFRKLMLKGEVPEKDKEEEGEEEW